MSKKPRPNGRGDEVQHGQQPVEKKTPFIPQTTRKHKKNIEKWEVFCRLPYHLSKRFLQGVTIAEYTVFPTVEVIFFTGADISTADGSKRGPFKEIRTHPFGSDKGGET